MPGSLGLLAGNRKLMGKTMKVDEVDSVDEVDRAGCRYTCEPSTL
jgi:hypothetical protein